MGGYNFPASVTNAHLVFSLSAQAVLSARFFRLRRRSSLRAFCRIVLASVSLSIREALTFRAFQRERRTFPVLDLAGVPFEMPFRQVAR